MNIEPSRTSNRQVGMVIFAKKETTDVAKQDKLQILLRQFKGLHLFSKKVIRS